MTPYYEEDGITIYHGDCREALPELPKADLVLTDPPYFIPAVSYAAARGERPPARTLGDLSILQGYFDALVPWAAAQPWPGGL